MSRQNPANHIPDFATREEEAEFWDTHDITDFLDELKPVKVRVSKTLGQGLTIRLNADDREALARRAEEQGIGPSTLARMWIKSQLRDDRAAS